MPQTTLETSAAAQYAVLVTLSWSNLPTAGDAVTYKRYTNWTSDLDINGDASEVFESTPTLQVDLGEIHGGTEDKHGKMTIGRDSEPFDVLRKGLIHPSVSIVVEHLDPTNMLATRRKLFTGQLGKIHANPAGKTSLVRSELLGIKDPLKGLKVGYAMTPSCQLPFGGPICGYDKEATKQVGTVLAVGSPRRVSIQLSVGNGTSPNERFRRGKIMVAGMSLAIRQSYDDGFFDTFRTPPEWIVGKDVWLYEGCDKQLSTCRVFDREESFVGLGIKIPSRNPVFGAGE